MTLAFHPYANLFPLIEGQDFYDLAEDIRINGLHDRIDLIEVDGGYQVLDGRNRYRALIWLMTTGEALGEAWGTALAGAPLTAEHLADYDNLWLYVIGDADDGDPLAYVLSKNLRRRHLDESQRAMVAARLPRVGHGGDRGKPSIEGLSTERRAELLNVGRASVERAEAVQEHAAPELVEAVDRGAIAVSTAAELAAQPVERQAEILKNLPRDESGKLTPDVKKALGPVIREIRAEKVAVKKERRAKREETLGRRLQTLPAKMFGVAIEDFEWDHEPWSRQTGLERHPSMHYETAADAHTPEEIVARCAERFACLADDCILFKWSTGLAKRRARRIAADEAHSWARNLKLGNIHAKLVLSMLTLYVDYEGVCWVSATALAEDCEISDDTVRKRLAWLDEIGAIAKTPQWIDASGRRNGDGNGKRTTDKIRLLYDADPSDIEARAAGERPAISTEISPRPQRGLNEDENPASPRLASGQPPHCGGGLISEPEPESPPLPPSGGERAAQVEEIEPEDFQPAWIAWRGHEVMRRDLALDEFRQLSKDKQRLCRAAVPLFNALQDKLGRDRVPNFHLWIRTRGFEEFPNATLAEDRPPPPERRFMQGDELAGFIVATRIAEQREALTVEDQQLGKGIWTRRSLGPDLVAMSMFVNDKRSERDAWELVEEGSPRFAAWRDRLRLWLGHDVKAERVWIEPFDPSIHGLSATHPDFKLRKSKNGFRVPAPWPPRRDGSWSTDSGDAA